MNHALMVMLVLIKEMKCYYWMIITLIGGMYNICSLIHMVMYREILWLNVMELNQMSNLK